MEKFEACLRSGNEQLLRVYNQIPDLKKISAEEKVRRNHKLRELFGLICQTDGSEEFIKAFLSEVPILNEDLRYSVKKEGLINQPKKNSKPLLIAIEAKALKNVETLLNIAETDVNVADRSSKFTPLVMLFKLLSVTNYEFVRKLIEKLAELKADINMGYFRKHPLSALCELKIDPKIKKHMVMLCLEKFDCDVKELYEGKTQQDIIAIGIPATSIRQVSVKANHKLLKTLLTASNEYEFQQKFKTFYDSLTTDNFKQVYDLLEWAALKGRVQSVELIFEHIKDDKRLKSDDQIRLLKQLKQICKNGDPGILHLFLNYLRPAVRSRNYDDLIMLTCVKELHKNRTPKRLECFQLVLNDRRISAEISGPDNETALHLTVKYGMDEESRSILTKRSPYLGSLTDNSETPLHRMGPDVLKPFLDSRVTVFRD